MIRKSNNRALSSGVCTGRASRAQLKRNCGGPGNITYSRLHALMINIANHATICFVQKYMIIQISNLTTKFLIITVLVASN